MTSPELTRQVGTPTSHGCNSPVTLILWYAGGAGVRQRLLVLRIVMARIPKHPTRKDHIYLIVFVGFETRIPPWRAEYVRELLSQYVSVMMIGDEFHNGPDLRLILRYVRHR